MLAHFVGPEAEYLAWLRAHPRGYVVNTYRTPSASYLKLHRATCWTIDGTREANYTSGDYSKVCAETVTELEDWARRTLGGSLDACSRCDP